MAVYFNENDSFPAAWLRELWPGANVDERSIEDVQVADVDGFERCHFFGGIGGWEYALQLAGWPAGEPVWTGSCPCQPFSNAGKREAEADKRHLWPEFRRLIVECRPPIVFGEQVASKLGREWLAGVRADLEALGYAVGAADLCAAGAGAPHIRQRLFWVANSASERFRENTKQSSYRQTDCTRNGRRHTVGGSSSLGGAGYTETNGRVQECSQLGRGIEGSCQKGCEQRPWDDFSVVQCHDGKQRRIPVEPEFFPLADGVPARVGRLRGYGNAIVPQVAATFIRSFMEAAA